MAVIPLSLELETVTNSSEGVKCNLLKVTFLVKGDRVFHMEIFFIIM